MSTKARVGIDITARDTTGAAFRGVQAKLSQMERGFNAAKRVVQGFAVGTMGAALGQSLKSAVDRMDDMGKAAQRMGVGVENLSRLGLAAKLSDVSIEQLGASMNKLNRNMAAIAAGDGGEAGRAFKAIGVSVTDAAGQLKSGDQVMRELADRFSRLQDGAGKTALAMAIFGKSGADMIPLLNGGSAAMRDLGDEADRTGQTISESAARNAEVLNDNITRLQGRAEGFANLLAQKLVPDLIDFSDRLLGAADSSAAAEKAMGWMDQLKEEAGRYFATSKAELDSLMAMGSAGAAILADPFMAAADATKIWNEAMAKSQGLMRAAGTEAEMLRQQVERTGKGSLPGTMSGDGRKTALSATPFIPSVPKRPKVDREHNAALAEAKSLYEGTRTAAEQYGLTISKIDGLLGKGLITQDTYSRAVFQAKWALGETKVEAFEAGEALLDLGGVFKDGFGSAFSAIMDGTRSVSQAFSDMGRSILQSVSETFANKAFGMLINAVLGSSEHGLYGGGGSGLLGMLGGSFSGFFAKGGHIPSGSFGVAGESGPELITGPANVMPMGRHGGGQSVVIEDRRVNAPPIDRQQVDGTLRFIVRDEVRQQVPGAVRNQLGAFGVNAPAIKRGGLGA